MTLRNASGESVDQGLTKIPDVPEAPTVGTATDVGTGRAYNNAAASVTFTPSSTGTGGPTTNYTVTSSPGAISATGTSSPITVTGLNSQTSYTFTTTANNVNGAASAATAATGSLIVTSIPDAPSSVVATDQGSSRPYNNGQASVAFSAPASGGKTISTYTVTPSPATSPTTFTGSSSPVIVTGLSAATAYTYTVTATNANGTGNASSASSPTTATTLPQAPTIGTPSVTNATTVSIPFTAGNTGGSTITSYTTTSSPSISLSTSGTSSPLTVTGTFAANTAYTFQIAAVNVNGTGSASSASSSLTPNLKGMVSIATITAAGAETSLTFSSIPQTYTDLQIRAFYRDSSNQGGSQLQMTFNNDSGASSYSVHGVYGNGTSATIFTGGTNNCLLVQIRGADAGFTSNVFSPSITDIADYTNTAKYKTIKSFAGSDNNAASTAPAVSIQSGAWLNTNSVTSITLKPSGTGFAAGVIVALYGVKAAA